MTTVVNGGTDSGNGAAMLILAVVLAAVVGLGIYFFSNGGGMSKTENIHVDAPLSAPSAPAPAAPSMPAPSGGSGQ